MKAFLFGFIDMENFQELWKMGIGFPDAAAESLALVVSTLLILGS